MPQRKSRCCDGYVHDQSIKIRITTISRKGLMGSTLEAAGVTISRKHFPQGMTLEFTLPKAPRTLESTPPR
jgi:hypothetical protein